MNDPKPLKPIDPAVIEAALEDYNAPRVTVLGSVAELTQNHYSPGLGDRYGNVSA